MYTSRGVPEKPQNHISNDKPSFYPGTESMEGDCSQILSQTIPEFETLCKLLNSETNLEENESTQVDSCVFEVRITNQILEMCASPHGKVDDALFILNGQGVYIHDFLLKAQKVSGLLQYPIHFKHEVYHYLQQLNTSVEENFCVDVLSLLTTNDMVVQVLLCIACQFLLYPRTLLDITSQEGGRKTFLVGDHLKKNGPLLHAKKILLYELETMGKEIHSCTHQKFPSCRPHVFFACGWTDGRNLHEYYQQNIIQVSIFPYFPMF